MARYRKKINYREKYPGLNDEIIEVLEKSDRKMEYQQYDLKVERCHIDIAGKTVTYFPSREDSYDRLLEEKHQFVSADESVEDTAVKTLLIEKMLLCFKQLAPEEQELIQGLFFQGKSEQEYGKQIGLSQKGVNKRKHKILRKLKKMMRI